MSASSNDPKVPQTPLGISTDAPSRPSVAEERPLANAPTAPKPSESQTAGSVKNEESKPWYNRDIPSPGLSEVPGATGTEGQREVPCPICNGSFLVNYAGRVFSSIIGFIGKTFNIRIEINQTIKDYVIERLPYSKRAAFTNSKCPVCGGKGTVTDVTDDRAKYVQAANVAQGYAKEIEENEAKLGTGGNEYKIVSGHVVHEVGLGVNDAPSYRQDPEGGVRLKGFAGWGKSGQDPKTGPIPGGGRYTTTTGINTIASPGGQYTIKCSNKFSVLAGALGVEITTGGPVTIKGGITRITGPEITIGTQVGKLGLEGEVVDIVGKSIEVGPKDGQFVVRGSSYTTGQHTVGGNLHAESASIVKLSTVGRNEPSKISSPGNLYSGPAFWGGQSREGIEAALKELLAFVLQHVTNPELQKYITSPRYANSLLDNEINIAYATLPQELVQTGYALVAGIKYPVFNFPHIHAQFDQPHYHETRVPDIDCSAESSTELRARQVGQNLPAPMHQRTTSIIDVLRTLFKPIDLAWTGIYYAISRNFTGIGKGSA